MNYKTVFSKYSFPALCTNFLYFIFLISLTASPIYSISAQPVDTKTPEHTTARRLDNTDLAPRTLDTDYHNEFWTYHFYMDNGMQLILRFSVANFGIARNPVSGAKISIINLPDTDQTFDASKQYPYKELSYDTALSHLQLKEGKDVWFKGDINEEHLVKFDTNKDGNSYDVELKLFDAEPGLVPSTSGTNSSLNTAIPSKEISVMIHIPYAKTEGYVSINGQRYNVSGTVYMDHIYLNKGVANLFNSGMRFIQHSSDTSWTAGYIAETNNMEGYPLVGYAVKKSGSNNRSMLFPLNKTERNSSSIDGRSYPSSLDLTFSGHTRYTMNFTKAYQSLSVLEDVGGFKKFVAKKYLGGEVINFRGIGRLNDTEDFYFNYFKVN